MTIGNRRKESKLPQKVALCHNELNTEVSFRQNTRTEGKAKDSRTKPEVFPKYHNVTSNLYKKVAVYSDFFVKKTHIE